MGTGWLTYIYIYIYLIYFSTPPIIYIEIWVPADLYIFIYILLNILNMILKYINMLKYVHRLTGKNASVVRETDASRHNGGRIEGPPQTTQCCDVLRGFRGLFIGTH